MTVDEILRQLDEAVEQIGECADEEIPLELGTTYLELVTDFLTEHPKECLEWLREVWRAA